MLASLNHPNIAHIYGLEDSGDVTALVIELVEGPPTLADRIAEGPIPLDEALAIARQVTLALEAAHERGIVHRDLKPANVKVTADGDVKVLDFGLAKALEGNAGDPSESPTLATGVTGAGVILGTAAYMAPEQARGKPVDRRADIWAFGVVLFEMLTGKRAFEAEDVSLTLAEVMKSEPDWASLPREVAPVLRTYLNVPRANYSSPRLSPDGSQLVVQTLDERHDGTLWVYDLSGDRSMRQLTFEGDSQRPIWTPDGERVTFASTRDGQPGIFWQPADGSRVAERLTTSTDGNGHLPSSWSPDGRVLTFMAGTAPTWDIWTLSIEDGATTSVYDAPDAFYRGPEISPDGRWLAYSSNGEVYVEPFPPAGGASLVPVGEIHFLPPGVFRVRLLSGTRRAHPGGLVG